MAPPCRRPPQPGFTLVEILVVMVAIAVLAGTAVLSLGSAEARHLKGEAAILRIRLNHLADEALITQQDLKWLYQRDSGQCRIYRMTASGDWRAEAEADPRRNGCRLQQFHRLELSTHGNANSLIGSAEDDPTLYFFASGEYLPFHLTLAGRTSDFILTGDGFNPIVLESTAP